MCARLPKRISCCATLFQNTCGKRLHALLVCWYALAHAEHRQMPKSALARDNSGVSIKHNNGSVRVNGYAPQLSSPPDMCCGSHVAQHCSKTPMINSLIKRRCCEAADLPPMINELIIGGRSAASQPSKSNTSMRRPACPPFRRTRACALLQAAKVHLCMLGMQSIPTTFKNHVLLEQESVDIADQRKDDSKTHSS